MNEPRPLFITITMTRNQTKVENSGQEHNIYYVLTLYIPPQKNPFIKNKIVVFRKLYNTLCYTMEQVFEIAIEERKKLSLKHIHTLTYSKD